MASYLLLDFKLFIHFTRLTESYLMYLWLMSSTSDVSVRQCVPVTFSKSGVFSGKWDPEPGNSGTEFPVDFRSGNEVRNLAFFESPKIGPKISPKISLKIRPKGVKNDPKMTKFGLF